MRNKLVVLMGCLVTTMPLSLMAQEVTGLGSFSKQEPGTDRQIPIVSALFTDKVTFEVRIHAKDGEHALLVNIYDGKGREVVNVERVIAVKNNVARTSILYGFDPHRDAPGTWWYVAAVGNKVVVSRSIQVLDQEPNKAVKGDVPKGTRP